MVGSKKARSVGDNLNGFCLIGGDEVGMSTGYTLHGVLRSSILVASTSAVSINNAFNCCLLSLLSLGLMSWLLLCNANCNFFALHLMPAVSLRCSNSCSFKNFSNSSYPNSSCFPASKAAAPNEVGEAMVGMGALTWGETSSQLARTSDSSS